LVPEEGSQHPDDGYRNGCPEPRPAATGMVELMCRVNAGSESMRQAARAFWMAREWDGRRAVRSFLQTGLYLELQF